MDKTGYSTISQLKTTSRHFRLTNELEKGENDVLNSTVNYKLRDQNDNTLTNWNGTIEGPPQTNYEGRVYQLRIECGQQYPLKPPIIKFYTKINHPIVNPANGRVEPSKFGPLNNWKQATTIQTILYELKKELTNHPRFPQPKEQTYY